MPTFNALHHNIVAKEIREQWPQRTVDQDDLLYGNGYLAASGCLTLLTLSLAKRFKKDSPVFFDPLRWLDQCSPDPYRIPLSELWEDYAKIR